jgi:hypothetical protein
VDLGDGNPNDIGNPVDDGDVSNWTTCISTGLPSIWGERLSGSFKRSGGGIEHVGEMEY